MKEKMNGNEYIKALTGQESKKEFFDKEEKKICYILGTANSRVRAPFDTKNSNAEFWGVAHCLLLQDIRRIDKVFELHLPYIYNQEVSPFSQKPILYHANKEYDNFRRANGKDIKCVIQKEDKNINSFEIFPREYLKEKYMKYLPVSDAFYATNSIAWMILKAIDEDFEEIHLYGIHLETTGEWAYERPCNEFWLGFFMGIMKERGIENPVVYMPEESDVLRGYHEYGYADIEVRRKKIQAKIDFDNKIIEDMKNQRNFCVNEINRLQAELNVPTSEKKKQLEYNMEQLKKELEIINSMTEENYEKNIKEKIQDLMRQNDMNLRQIDARLNAFQGAKDRAEYFLNELNA